MTDSKVYETSDIYLAATLKTNDIHLDSFRRRGTRTLFIFQRSERSEDLVRGYYEDTISVSPKRLRNALRELKTVANPKEQRPRPI